MIVTESKPVEQILEQTSQDKKLFLLGCGGCADVCQTNVTNSIGDLAKKLTESGKEVTGWVVIDFLCNKVLIASRLQSYLEKISNADAVLILSCGIGVQAVSKVVPRPAHPALNTISMGGFPGVWPSTERCAECGDCVLSLTAGICPVTTCAKSLMNGACGGSSEGECEVEKKRECGWALIYDRLKSLGREDNLKRISTPRDYGKFSPDNKRRQSEHWTVDGELADEPIK